MTDTRETVRISRMQAEAALALARNIEREIGPLVDAPPPPPSAAQELRRMLERLQSWQTGKFTGALGFTVADILSDYRALKQRKGWT